MSMVRSCFAAVAVAFSVLLASLSAAPDEPAKTLSPAQRKELQAHLGDFRKARNDPAKRLEVVDKVIEIGGPAVNTLLDVITKELYPQLNGYRDRFYKQAEKAAVAKAKSANLQEVTELRTKVLDLSKNEQLTKEMIVEVGDPAIKRLTEMMVLDRETVLKNSPDLVKQRDAMGDLGKCWEKCVVYLASQTAPGEEKPAELPSFPRYLEREEELAVQLAVPMDSGTRGVLAGNARLATQIDPEEARCVLSLNLMRNLLGLSPVQIDLALTGAARDHSNDMETRKFFDHTSPVEGKTTPWDRAKRFNTSASAENIAMGTLDGSVANLMWWHSPGHHKNMLGNHARVGLGRTGRYWTELFGR